MVIFTRLATGGLVLRNVLWVQTPIDAGANQNS